MKRQRRRKLQHLAARQAEIERFNEWASPSQRALRAQMREENELRILASGGGPKNGPKHRGGTYGHRFTYVDGVGVVPR